MKTRSNIIYSKTLLLTAIAMLGVCFAANCLSAVSDPNDSWTDADIQKLDAQVSGGYLTVQVTERKPFSSFMYSTPKVSMFLDKDQNPTTGIWTMGAVAGMEYRINCANYAGMLTNCDLEQLPVNFGEDKITTPFGQIPGAAASASDRTLTVRVPIAALGGSQAFDLFAITYAEDSFYGVYGNGDRCPNSGAFNTNTGNAVVRRPAAAVNVTLADKNGDGRGGGDLTSAKFRTFGDQFEITLTFANPIDPVSFASHLSGGVILDSDRSLSTGNIAMRSPMGLGNTIPSWGGDAELLYYIDGLGSQFHLFFIDDPDINPLVPFGPPGNDGSWRVQGNQLVMTGSLSIFDAYELSIDSKKETKEKRKPTDGRMIARAYAGDILTGILAGDVMPEAGRALDIGSRTIVTPLAWSAGSMISKSDPTELGPISGMDLIRVDAQVISNNLVVKGVLASWYKSDYGNLFKILLDTDSNASTGEQVINDLAPGSPAIGADYIVRVRTTDNYYNIGYYADLQRSNKPIEAHDAFLFPEPSDIGTGQFTVTVPLAKIGNPKTLRFFVSTERLFNNIPISGVYDVAPINPLVISVPASNE